MGYTVTARIKRLNDYNKQYKKATNKNAEFMPYGGILKSTDFTVTSFSDKYEICEKENIDAGIIGSTVEYLSEYLLESELEKVFKIPIQGAEIAKQFLGDSTRSDCVNDLRVFLSNIKGLDDNSIINACRATAYGVWYRNKLSALFGGNPIFINPDRKTIDNIKIMVERCHAYFLKNGPIKEIGFRFENGGYSDVVTEGDGDILTKDTLWDLKTSKKNPTTDDRIQLIMYYVMALHSKKRIFRGIKRIGFFNPRLNKEYICDVKNISKEVIKTIEDDYICYSDLDL